MFCLKTAFFCAWKVLPRFWAPRAIFAYFGHFHQNWPVWPQSEGSILMSRTWNYNQKILQVSYFLPIYSFMGLESTQTTAGHAKVDKKFSIFRFQGKSLPKPPRNLKYGGKCLFLALRRLFCKMRLWESKWGNTNVLPPYLLRLNFPNLEGIEIEVICDDFGGALKLDVQKMAKIPF